jgi:hypothetical protein
MPLAAVDVPWAMVLAHAGEEGGTSLPLLIAGAVVAAVGLGVWRSRRALAMVALVAGMGLAVLAFILPRIGAETPEAAVTISHPTDGQEVDAGEPLTVRVELRGAEVASSPTDSSGGHLHLYVDGELQQMPYSTTAEITLQRGEHVLEVEYVDHEHVSFDPEIATSVKVVAV